jgi:hypothetical protein
MIVQIDKHHVFHNPQPFHYVPYDDAPTTLAVKKALAGGTRIIAPYVPPMRPQILHSSPSAGQSSVIAD